MAHFLALPTPGRPLGTTSLSSVSRVRLTSCQPLIIYSVLCNTALSDAESDTSFALRNLKFAKRGLLHKLVPSVLRLRLSSGEPDQTLASEQETVLISKHGALFITTLLAGGVPVAQTARRWDITAAYRHRAYGRDLGGSDRVCQGDRVFAVQ